MSNALATCNGCGKPISMLGVKTAKLMAGDYTVEYFLCPHCGRKYVFRTTDTEQRQLVKKHTAIIQKRKLGIAKKFKLKTLNKYYKEQKKVYKKLQERSQALMQIGRVLLEGEALANIQLEIGEERLDDTETGNTTLKTVSSCESGDQGEAGNFAETGADKQTDKDDRMAATETDFRSGNSEG